MSIFTVVWPFVTVLVLALLAVAVLQTRITRRFTAPASTRLDSTHLLLANLLGSVVVVWSIARIAAPSLLLGWLDGVARFLFAAWQVYAVAHGASAVVLGFTLFELLFGVLQWWRVGPQRQAPVSALAPAGL